MKIMQTLVATLFLSTFSLSVHSAPIALAQPKSDHPSIHPSSPKGSAGHSGRTEIKEAQLTQLSDYLITKKEEFLNDLDYFSSKGIDFEASYFSGRVAVRYKARWGYRGAGDESQPFKGFKGTVTIPVTLAKGLTIDPLQADKAKQLIEDSTLKQLIEVSPSDEFKLKLTSLFITANRDDIPAELVLKELKVLLKRIAITPSFEGIEISGFRIVGTPDQAGYLDSFSLLPDSTLISAQKWLTHLFKALSPLFGLLQRKTDSTALKKLLAGINYNENTDLVISSQGEQLAKVVFGYKGIGNGATPLGGCYVVVDVPFVPAIGEAVSRVETRMNKLMLPPQFYFPLGPVTECSLKAFMLMASVYNGTFPIHEVPTQIEALLHRLLITPQVEDMDIKIAGIRMPMLGTDKNPGLLRILAFKAQSIMKHDFSQKDSSPLATAQAISLLLSIAYKAGIEYAAVRTKIRNQLAQTEQGKQLLSKVGMAMHEHETKQTSDTKAIFDNAMSEYRNMELQTGKEDFEKISSFVLQELGRLTARTKPVLTFEGFIKNLGLVKEFEEHGIKVDVKDFYTSFASAKCE